MDDKNGVFFSYVNLQTLRLEPDDVHRAVEVFENRFGQRPLALGLHKGCAPQIKAAAEFVILAKLVHRWHQRVSVPSILRRDFQTWRRWYSSCCLLFLSVYCHN